MNTIIGRAAEACVAVGNAVCREHALRQNVATMTMTGANPFTSETRKRIGSPSAKKYNRTGNENRPVYPIAFFSELQSIQYPHSAAPAMAQPASCLAKGK